MQVGRKTRGAVELGDIAIGRVILHRSGDEVLQALLSAFTRRVPSRRELAVPLDLREQAELGDRDRLQGLVERGELLGGLERDAELEVREAVLPKGGEDLEGISSERPNTGSGRTFWRAHLKVWEKLSFRCAWVEGAA